MTKYHTQNSNYAIKLTDPTIIVLLIDKYFIVLFWLHNMHKSMILHLQESCFEYMGENGTLLKQELYCWILNRLWKSDNQPIVEIRWSQDCPIPTMIFLFWEDGIFILNQVAGPWIYVTLSRLMDWSWSIHICSNYGSQHGPEYLSLIHMVHKGESLVVREPWKELCWWVSALKK